MVANVKFEPVFHELTYFYLISVIILIVIIICGELDSSGVHNSQKFPCSEDLLLRLQ